MMGRLHLALQIKQSILSSTVFFFSSEIFQVFKISFGMYVNVNLWKQYNLMEAEFTCLICSMSTR
jgi:hypothetical protein